MFDKLKSNVVLAGIKFDNIKQYLISQLEQASTWRAIVFFVMYVLGKSTTDVPEISVLTFSTMAAYMVGLLFPDNSQSTKVTNVVNPTTVVVAPVTGSEALAASTLVNVAQEAKEASNGLSNPS